MWRASVPHDHPQEYYMEVRHRRCHPFRFNTRTKYERILVAPEINESDIWDFRSDVAIVIRVPSKSHLRIESKSVVRRILISQKELGDDRICDIFYIEHRVSRWDSQRDLWRAIRTTWLGNSILPQDQSKVDSNALLIVIHLLWSFDDKDKSVNIWSALRVVSVRKSHIPQESH